MLIISTLLLAVSFLTQVAVAAPIPLNGRAPYDDVLFSRTVTNESKAPPNKTLYLVDN